MSGTASVDGYIKMLEPEQRVVVSKLRAFILKHLPRGYVESMCMGMPSYVIPLTRYPKTYNGKPLGYISLAARKGMYSLYLIGCYMSPEQDRSLRAAYAKAGKKLDMGKSCLRFKKLDDVMLPSIGKLIASMPVEDFIERYEASRKK
ncbi:MAG TPA: DUF1801 domain-containing protein [Rudaea sp.]|jgi:hypothetical protein|nr:DUF1801 domain-containing protein [Rudaea sp.]